LTHNVLGFSIKSKDKQILHSPYSETRLEGESDGIEGTGSSVVRVRIVGDDIEGAGTSVVRVRIKGDDIKGAGTSVMRVRAEGNGILSELRLRIS
jgi:hypothetical protein